MVVLCVVGVNLIEEAKVVVVCQLRCFDFSENVIRGLKVRIVQFFMCLILIFIFYVQVIRVLFCCCISVFMNV